MKKVIVSDGQQMTDKRYPDANRNLHVIELISIVKIPDHRNGEERHHYQRKDGIEVSHRLVLPF
jgi:hypothetical protein